MESVKGMNSAVAVSAETKAASEYDLEAEKRWGDQNFDGAWAQH